MSGAQKPPVWPMLPNPGDRSARPFGAGYQHDYVLTKEFRRERSIMRAARAAEMEDVLYEIAINEKEMGFNRINAAAKLHAICDGTPMSREKTITEDGLEINADTIPDDPVLAAEYYRRMVTGNKGDN